MTHRSPQHMMGIAVVVLVAAVLHGATARDLRRVSEPKIPASCVSLKGNGQDHTAELQKALNSCAKGKTVHLASGAFVSGPLNIPSGVGLWIDNGVVLKASTVAKLYSDEAQICGTVDTRYHGCKTFITMKNAVGSGIYGKGTIDGQGGVKLVGQTESWWDLAHRAQVENKNENSPYMIQIANSSEVTLYQITIKNAPIYHVVVEDTNGFTAWGVTLDTPTTARNTDGIDPGGSQNITIAHCSISCGDDNVAIKAGRGATRHISVTNTYFGSGHGLSIGGETNGGVSDLTVDSVVFNGTLNGLHIKSDHTEGGLVSGVSYSNVCMRNVEYPILLDTHYFKTASGNLLPEYRDITFNNIDAMTPGKFIFDGYSDAKPIVATLRNVRITKGSSWTVSHAKISGKYTEGAIGKC